MDTQNRNMGGGLSYRNSKIGSRREPAQVKPLRELGGLSGPPRAPEGFNQPSPQPKMSAPSHSKHSAERSVKYHAKIVGQDPRLVDELNPTKTLKASRSFPGLANGE